MHVSYGLLIQELLKKFNYSRSDAGIAPVIKGLAHITGGGFVDNIPRILPKKCDVTIRKGSWEMLPIFDIIQAKGGVPEEELYQVFNMGIGMTVMVDPRKAEAVLKFIRARGQKSWMIGEVIQGEGKVKLVD